MKFIADFHIHSHYSIATSSELTPEFLDYWARLKGITVVGTGDFTHPLWIEELKEKLEPAERGLFQLKRDYRKKTELETPFLPRQDVRFMLTAEISTIYKKNGKVRKVHNVIFAPDFETAERIRHKLTTLGANITSDGRPILGMDSRDLLEIALEADENIFFVPAHIWTPWFSALGSKSGFDTIAECYADLANHIHAVETGLSTDPPMNWLCRFLDGYTLISNSDSHSPDRLGRNANRFDTELSYDAIVDALKTGSPQHFLGSIDLFPQEGKYHFDGHRKCGICWNPLETLQHDGICTVCGKGVTVGVMNRVVQLSDREDIYTRPNRHDFQSIIPLKEILGELEGCKADSPKTARAYMALIKKGIPEMELLLDTRVEEIAKIGSDGLAEAIRRMRNREIYIQEGYDGEYGIIKVFGENEKPGAPRTNLLFKDMEDGDAVRNIPAPRQLIPFDLEEYRRLKELKEKEDKPGPTGSITGNTGGIRQTGEAGDLNPEQLAAVRHLYGPALVIAGPGTGKTNVLTRRIMHLIQTADVNVNGENILAVTFTNKAAREIDERLENLLETAGSISKPHVCTFHGFGYSILNELHPGMTVLLPEDKIDILRGIQGVELSKIHQASNAIEKAKQRLLTPDQLKDLPEDETGQWAEIYRQYDIYLHQNGLFDLDDLLYRPVMLFKENPGILSTYRQKYRFILIDEYQDVNFAQYELVRLLKSGVNSVDKPTDNPSANPSGNSTADTVDDRNLMVIGDPDQAIYGFRGADVAFIRRFQDDYPNAIVYTLKQSYRCSSSILDASQNVIRGSSRNLPEGKFLTGIEEGIKIKIIKNPTGKSEAEFIARTVEQMMGGLRFFSIDSSITGGEKETEIESLSDFAVLCRTKAQMETLEKAFTDHSIPYQVIGEEPFYKQEPADAIIDLLKLCFNPNHPVLKKRLIDNRIISLHDLETISSIPSHLKQVKDILLYLIYTYFNRFCDEKPGIELVSDGQKPFRERVFGFPKASDIENLDKVLGGVRTFLQKGSDKLPETAVIKRLLDWTADFGEDIDRFLETTALGTAADTYRPGLENVAVMTLHAAKGLEFNAVFIPGCEEGLIPYSLFKNQTCDRDEERRLLYVGMTRAKKFLFLCHAEKRRLMGQEFHLHRSSFLDRIERELVELSEPGRKKKNDDGPVQRSLFSNLS